MAGHFEATPGGGAAVALDEVEIAILRSLAVQLLELIGPGDEPAEGEDPLAALFAEGPSEPPSDPALARLFPEAYGDDDTELRAASAEFRRFTENDLRTRKRDDALVVVRTLDALTPQPEEAPRSESGRGGGRGAGGVAVLTLDADECRSWLGSLNDLRLTIGTRLEVSDEDGSEDGSLYRLPDSDPRKPMVMAYLWLGALQETLIETLMQ
ncbi:DUF2017 domain-containing protein [Streptomyces sp. NBC_01013]|uniref:DUF2017 domain-containing protein n=1 Tax=Streptomyces sp. NBC_01013 TaxID=2903718 RepID=UPI00386E5DCC|nr:DUF2017 domain-containing protein [Streptomyces sp. NBC_01013]